MGERRPYSVSVLDRLVAWIGKLRTGFQVPRPQTRKIANRFKNSQAQRKI